MMVNASGLWPYASSYRGSGKAVSQGKTLLPSFLIIGPPRTGTSWLHEVLREHAALPKLTKETRFFDTHFQRGMDWYRSHFPKKPADQPIGEIAPTYFASPEARERIGQVIPGARVICVFRNPVERIISLYRLKRAYGMIPWSFEQAIDRDPELMASSRYATNLKAWQRTLGKQQVLPTIYDDLRDEPQTYIDRLADFIGIPRFELTTAQVGYVHSSEHLTHPRSYHRTRYANNMADWFKARRLHRVVTAVKQSPVIKYLLGGGLAFSELPEDLALELYEKLRPEVEDLEVMLNRDLSAWKPMGAAVSSVSAVS